jgi:hypothetical protein
MASFCLRRDRNTGILSTAGERLPDAPDAIAWEAYSISPDRSVLLLGGVAPREGVETTARTKRTAQ